MSIGTMHETAQLLDDSQPGGAARSQSATTKVPEVEIHLFKTDQKGLIDVFKWNLGGTEKDKIEVRPILEKYGLTTIMAYEDDNGRRGVPIRFDPNGRSVLTYRDGTVVYIIGVPYKNPVIEYIKIIVLGTVFATLLKTFLVRLLEDLPPWVFVCIIIAVSVLRKSSRDLYRDLRWYYHRS